MPPLPRRALTRSSDVTTKTLNNKKPEPPTILLVDGGVVSSSIKVVLESNQFRVITAENVGEALHLIDNEHFDALLCALHMTEAGDGFSVVNAMRHTTPEAVTLVYTGYPELERAVDAILLPADEVVVKSTAIPALVSMIHDKLKTRETREATGEKSVASILERRTLAIITDWLSRAERGGELTWVSLSKEQRVGHLPKLLQELVYRLRRPRKLGTKGVSKAALALGKVRRSQGYSVSMIVEEFRILKVIIFETVKNDLDTKDSSLLLTDVMTIANECDSQLKQTLTSFMGHSMGIAA
jgi:ActR/RegA family two-component response regulator